MPVIKRSRRIIYKTTTSAFMLRRGMPATLCLRLGNHIIECLPIIQVHAFSETSEDKPDRSLV